MKKITLWLLAFVPMAFVSCEKIKSPAPEQVKASITTGTWYVASFERNGSPYFMFAGYDFTFAPGGGLNVKKGNTSVNGTWVLNVIENETTLDLQLGSSDPFNQLNQDWVVTDHIPTQVKTHDFDNGAHDIVVFRKNQ